MAKSKGKIFEEDFRKSIPSNIFVHRLKDSAMSYTKSDDVSFTWDNSCDFFVFSGKKFYAIECKSSKYSSMSVELEKEGKDSKKMIKYHQIQDLSKISKYENCIAGFMLNFRNEENNSQVLYFLEINDFLNMMNKIGKKSFNILDAIQNGAKKIEGQLLRTHYRWDLSSFFYGVN